MATESEKGRPVNGDDVGVSPADVLDRADEALGRIRAALRGLRYGTVTAIVQDGVIVQVERTEKVRVDRKGKTR